MLLLHELENMASSVTMKFKFKWARDCKMDGTEAGNDFLRSQLRRRACANPASTATTWPNYIK